MFKIAYGAGHFRYTAGNRLPRELDEDQTSEWELNDRIARYFREAAEQYEDVQLLRTDDPTGAADVGLAERCRRANDFGADFCLSIHHNAGANLTNAGGLVAFSFPGSLAGARFRDAIYEACLAAGGIRGNRAMPRTTANFYVLRYTAAPCVLMEYGFMDSRQDAPVILQDAFAKRMAYATMEGIAAEAGLMKKDALQEDYTQAEFLQDLQRIFSADAKGILEKTVTLSVEKNATHPAVLPVQKRLAALGYTQVGPADGIAGPKFRDAVWAYQRDHDCWRDGIITAGNKTWRCLLELE